MTRHVNKHDVAHGKRAGVRSALNRLRTGFTRLYFLPGLRTES